jgi:hypothetical protein
VLHASFYSVGNGDAFLGSEAAEAYPGYESMEPYLHSHMRFHGLYRNDFAFCSYLNVSRVKVNKNRMSREYSMPSDRKTNKNL